MSGDFLQVFDVIVVGGGAAGLRASIEAARMGARVAILSKAPIGYASSTLYAGGGFRAAFGKYSVERHFEETILGGCFINDQELVRAMVLEAPKRLLELRSFGVDLKLRDGGVYVEGPPLMTGLSLVGPLADFARKLGVQFIDGYMALDLVVDDGVNGLIALNTRSGEIEVFQCNAIVLATGGYSQLFMRSDNPVRVTGDGCAMALRAGAKLIDMEFVQFFPLGLAEDGMPTWIFPAVQGKLVNALGEDVLEKHGIKTPLHIAAIKHRDLLSRVIWREIIEGRGVGESLIIDLSRVAEGEVSRVLSSLASSLSIKLGIKMDKVRIAPLAHFTMGGIKVNVDCETGVPGLYACGEVVGGVHGANRLGGNALTEAVVFGARAGLSAAIFSMKRKARFNGQDLLVKYQRAIESFKRGTLDARQLKSELKRIMWYKCGVIRRGDELIDAQSSIRELRDKLNDVKATKALDLIEVFELRNMIEIAELVVRAALMRCESRGAHYRDDFVTMDNVNWLKRIVFQLIDGKLSVHLEPVILKYITLKL